MTCEATKHGTATAYQAYGCRCPEAREAQRRYVKRWRHERANGIERKVDATGTRRRIQALMRIGWPTHEIWRRLGYRNGNWIIYDAVVLNVRVAEAVRALYDELWDTPGPSKWTRTWATNQGFAPPMAWDDDMIDDPLCYPDMENVSDLSATVDEVVVQRLVDGADWRRLNATKAERLAAAEVLDARYRREVSGMDRAEKAVAKNRTTSRTYIENHLGLRAGRDFAMPSDSGGSIAS